MHRCFAFYPAANWLRCSIPWPPYLRLLEEGAFLSNQHNPKRRDIPKAVMNFSKPASPCKQIHVYSNDSKRKETSHNFFEGLTLRRFFELYLSAPRMCQAVCEVQLGSRVPGPGPLCSQAIRRAGRETECKNGPSCPPPVFPPLILWLGSSSC